MAFLGAVSFHDGNGSWAMPGAAHTVINAAIAIRTQYVFTGQTSISQSTDDGYLPPPLLPASIILSAFSMPNVPDAWRIFFERHKELPDDGRARNQGPQLVTPPPGIHHRFLRASEQIALDGLERDFPVIVAYGGEVSVVDEIEELMPRPFGVLGLEIWHEVVAIEVNLEGLVAHLHAFQALLLHVSAPSLAMRSILGVVPPIIPRW